MKHFNTKKTNQQKKKGKKKHVRYQKIKYKNHSFQLKSGFELASFELLFCLLDGVRSIAQPDTFFISWYSL